MHEGLSCVGHSGRKRRNKNADIAEVVHTHNATGNFKIKKVGGNLTRDLGRVLKIQRAFPKTTLSRLFPQVLKLK